MFILEEQFFKRKEGNINLTGDKEMKKLLQMSLQT